MLLPPEISALVRELSPGAWTLPAGVLLVAFGERVYRLLVLAPGLVLGMWLGAQAGTLLGLAPHFSAALAALLAFLGAMACLRAEALAVRAMGALGGVLACASIWEMVTHTTAPWWGAVLGGVVGLIVAPYLQIWLMRGLTSFVGALCVASYMGQPNHPLVVAGVTVLGIGFQTWMGGSSAPAAKKGKAGKR